MIEVIELLPLPYRLDFIVNTFLSFTIFLVTYLDFRRRSSWETLRQLQKIENNFNTIYEQRCKCSKNIPRSTPITLYHNPVYVKHWSTGNPSEPAVSHRRLRVSWSTDRVRLILNDCRSRMFVKRRTDRVRFIVCCSNFPQISFTIRVSKHYNNNDNDNNGNNSR